MRLFDADYMRRSMCRAHPPAPQGDKMKDILGRNIKVGDLVVNSVTQYRAAVLRLGVVMKIQEDRRYGETIYVRRATGSAGWTRPSKIAVVRWDFLDKDHVDREKLISIVDAIK